MQTTATIAASAAAADAALEQTGWQRRGLAALELAPVVEGHAALIVKPRDVNGRFRSTRGDIAFAIA